jgi:hypothetical protein
MSSLKIALDFLATATTSETHGDLIRYFGKRQRGKKLYKEMARRYRKRRLTVDCNRPKITANKDAFEQLSNRTPVLSFNRKFYQRFPPYPFPG